MRYSVLDCVRGISLISMVLYHGVWDLVYLFNVDLDWFRSVGGYVWQQSICISFILVSGFCWNLGKRKLKRGIIVFMAGVVITIVTSVVLPSQKILFGILTLIGSCMLLNIPLERMLLKINPYAGVFINFVLFLFFKNVGLRYVGFFEFKILELPDGLYNNLLTAYFGFPNSDFSSSDYFPLFPWFFLFLMGYFLYQGVKEKNMLKYFTYPKIKVVEFLGKHTLPIYIIHQPVLYFGLTLIFGKW